MWIMVFLVLFFKILGLIFYKKNINIKNIKNEIHNMKIINVINTKIL